MSVEREVVLGYRTVSGTRADCVGSVMDWIASGDRCRYLACMNPHAYAVAERLPAVAAALHDADWLVPDGIAVVYAARILGRPMRERIAGPDVFMDVTRELARRAGGARVFFLGSTEETLRKISARMSREYPQVQIVGTYSPPFRHEFSDSDNNVMLKTINAARPDVLWVGMTSPKQDLWIHQHRERLQVRFAAGIGAAFDFYAGQVRRAHPLLQRLGLEWLHRLLQEPARLWRRLVLSVPRFLFAVARARLGRTRP